MTTVAEVIAALDTAYPPSLAEPWDTGIGLSCGDRAAAVDRVLLAVDVDPATVDEAIQIGAGLLVTHHPLLFRPVQAVAADTDKGALIHTMIRSGIAHFAAHTNADRAVGGVGDALAAALGVVDTRPLIPLRTGAADATDAADYPEGVGLGRVGHLPAPTTLREFTGRVAAALPATAGGVRAAGNPDRSIGTVALIGGAGGGELAAATDSGADVFVTSDLSHHTAAEHVADPQRPALIDVAHFAGEWPWLAYAADVIRSAVDGSVTVTVSTRCTDPWTLNDHHRARLEGASPRGEG